MWKKSKNGLLKISVLLLCFLVLGVAQLSAWPQWLTGSESAERISQLQLTIAEKEETIASINLYIQELEKRLDELMKTSESWKNTNAQLEKYVTNLNEQLQAYKESLKLREQEVESLQTAYEELEAQLTELVEVSSDSEGFEVMKALVNQLNTQLKESDENLALAQTQIELLTNNLSQLETLSGLSKESFQSLMQEYLPLKEAYNTVVAERDKYYQEAVNAKADQDGFTGMIGADGILFDNGDFGAGIKLGAGWGDLMLTLGADYRLPVPLAFDVTKLSYRVGLLYKF